MHRPQLFRLVSKEADFSSAANLILAKPCSVLGRMKPGLKNTMCILTGIPLLAGPFAEFRAGNTAVRVFAWVSPPCVLPWMNKWTLGPVMGVSPRAGLHLETIHPKLIRSIYTIVYVRQ